MTRMLKTALILISAMLSLSTYAATPTPATDTTTAAPTTTTTPAAPKIKVSPADQAKIEQVVHDYLISKPEVIVEALQVLQRKQSEEAQKIIKTTQENAPKFANALFHDTSDPIMGNPNGKTTIVEFFDYQCPHCIDMKPVLSELIKSNQDIRLVLKDFPIRGQVSELAARASVAANIQGKYSEFHNELLSATQPLTEDSIYQVAKKAGLNVNQLKIDMAASSTTDKLKADIKLAQDLKLFGTPAFFIGRTEITDATGGNIIYAPGQMSQAQLQTIINKATS